MNIQPLSQKESNELLGTLFPNGLGGSDIKSELVPNGWKNSTFSVAFHPSVEQSYKEYIKMSRNLNRLSDEKEEPETTFDEFKEDFEEKPVKPEQELRELMGLCLWDIISDNHDIVTQADKLLILVLFARQQGL